MADLHLHLKLLQALYKITAGQLLLAPVVLVKVSVQTVMPLRGEGAMRLTTSRYYTPSGRSIQALGVSPNIIVEQPKRKSADSEEEESRRNRSEADLRGALSNDSLSEDEIQQIEADRLKAENAAKLREGRLSISLCN